MLCFVRVFAVTETIESRLAYQEGDKPGNLSVQEILDCDATSKGCAGGSTCGALKWLNKVSTIL